MKTPSWAIVASRWGLNGRENGKRTGISLKEDEEGDRELGYNCFDKTKTYTLTCLGATTYDGGFKETQS